MEPEYQIRINKVDAYYTDKIVKKSIESKLYKKSEFEQLRLDKNGNWSGWVGKYFLFSFKMIEVY